MFCALGCDSILGPVRSTSDPGPEETRNKKHAHATGVTDFSEKSNSVANQNDREEFFASGKLRLPSGVLHPQVM